MTDHLLPQMEGTFDALQMITRGGIIPGSMLAKRLDISHRPLAKPVVLKTKRQLAQSRSSRKT